MTAAVLPKHRIDVGAAVRRLVASLSMGLAAVAAAQPPPPPHLPDSPAPTHAQLVRALGEPPRAEVQPDRWEPRPSRGGPVRSADINLFARPVLKGGEFVLSYPALGLVVTIDRNDRPLADPPIRAIVITAPPDRPAGSPALRTPQGLYVGQPRQEALAIAARHFQPRSDSVSAARTATGSDPVTFLADGGRVLGSLRPAYALLLGFDAGQRVRELRYEFKPGLTQAGRWALAAAAAVAAGLAGWALRWAWQHKLSAMPLPVAGAGTTRVVGRGLVALGGLVAIGSTGALGLAVYTGSIADGNAYAGMGVLVLGMYALIGLLGAAVLWVIGRRIEGSA